MANLATDRWTRRHLLGLQDLTADEILAVLDTADEFFPFATGAEPAPQTLQGRTVLNLILEDSTRTRTSFTLAAERLGGRVVQFHAATSSMAQKGETLLDTARTLEAMGLDALVIRHKERGAPHRVADAVACPVLNAGDDAHEHPTQALLDLLALRHHFGRLDGLTVAICGDVRHSRVARSNLYGLAALGSRAVFVGPEVFLQDLEDLGVAAETSTDFDAVLPECDAVMMLRVQHERHPDLDLDLDAYRRGYQLTAERLARAKEGAPVLHPGPVNRGTELADDVTDGPQSLILHQVTCGVAVRMAALTLCIAAAEREADE
ncbi:MAG: aspartate carbamoyltransferase catalytic subunit [Phycisphaerae bacterium]